MATQIAGAGGTTTSFSNTPQAKDDLLAYLEDATGVLILNVLANDLGGAAKQLYSIDNADSLSTATKTYAPADLLTRDTTYSTDSSGASGTTDTSLLGAKIWIASDGTIHYDTTNIDGQLQALSAGQVLVDKVTYAIQLGNGTLSWATATVQFTGTNDKPDIHLVTTDSAAASLTETNAALTKSGTLTVNDADVSDTATASVASVSLAGTTGGLNSGAVLGMLTVSPASLTANPGETNNLGWTFNSAPQAFDFLAVGETLTLTYTIKVDDGHLGGTDTQTLTITLTGTNDTPTAVADTNSGLEDSTINGTVATNDGDVDDGAVLTYAQVGSVAGLIINADGSYSFDAANAAYQHLAQGATLPVVANYSVTDQHGASASSTLTITLTGTNDTPTAVADTNSGLEDSTINGTVASNDGDVDDGAVLTYAQVGSVAGLIINADG
ncbi:VCBS domain-containing protein, partial [Mesorhizobium sp. M0488]|uniref:VCBS domain-containing protein n=2 Tax=unclassified Mesorhizobium TaxID=325217 RepID=UPI0033382038